MGDDEPGISVVTAVRNGAAHLLQTIQSVRSQRGVSAEHVVIDGASTDGTVDIIREHADQLARWISEPDAGIADAMNKGIALTRGRWLLFLHADDYLADANSLRDALPHLDEAYDAVAFAIDREAPGGHRRQAPSGFRWWLNFKTTFPHQATFFHRRCFERLGGYDASYRIEMDYEFFLRMYRAGMRARLVPCQRLAVMRSGGLSSRRDWPSLSQRFAEERRIHLQHAQSPSMRAFYALYWGCYPRYRRLRELVGQGR